MEKLNLTKEYIIRTYQKVFLGKEMLGITLLISLIFVSDCTWATEYRSVLIFIAESIVTIYIIVWDIDKIVTYIKLKKGKFRIETDLLTHLKGEKSLEKAGPIINPPKFYFLKYGKFTFINKSYTFMIKNPRQIDGRMDHRVQVGDKFYIVMVGKKVVSVYNTRIFECDQKTDK